MIPATAFCTSSHVGNIRSFPARHYSKVWLSNNKRIIAAVIPSSFDFAVSSYERTDGRMQHGGTGSCYSTNAAGDYPPSNARILLLSRGALLNSAKASDGVGSRPRNCVYCVSQFAHANIVPCAPFY